MSKPLIGVVAGTILGMIDGLSAWFSPDARPIFITIVAGSTLKGLVTGLVAGLVARRRESLMLGVATAVAVGFALSHLAAMNQPDHYVEIVLPGMLLGAIVGFVTQRYPRVATGAAGLAVLLMLPMLAHAQQAADPLAAVAPLVGRWTGTSEGQPGRGSVEREYSRALGSRFIRLTNRSTYPPQEKNPKGEKHEDEGFFSFDRARKQIVLRQFHVEGFVNTYVQDLDARPGTVVFISEAIENIPPGFRARETYILTGADSLEEVFEMAEPGKEFAVYSRTRLSRVK